MLKSSNSPFRLPEYIKPIKYHLVLNPDLPSQTYTGSVKIDIEIAKKINTIFVHSKDLEIAHVFIRQNNGKKNSEVEFIPKIKPNKKDSYIELIIDKKISGKAEVEIFFSGLIRDDLYGFYISKYLPAGKEETELIGATQFEAIYARMAFPCFDEPAMKAVFLLDIIVDKSLDVITNTEETKKIVLDNGKIHHIFAPTPKMSTYLLAWTIGKFETLNAKSRKGKTVRVNTPLGKKESGKFALNVAVKVLNYFEDYFKIDYPLTKMDLVALPDFASGAMENWGLITFRETCLLVDKNNSSLVNQQNVALVIAHEIAHQWFGNLVTMAWWDDLWLNEGFANWIEYACIDSIYPEWNVWEDFTHGDIGDAMRLDSLASSHPIEVPIENAEDIDEIFDGITYRKGATVIHMLAEYIGQKNFQKGLQNYMKANSYKNATTKNLWMHLERASRKPVSRVMGAWTKKTGFPVLMLNDLKGKTICSQCRYYRNRAKSEKFSDDGAKTLWPVPLNDGTKTYLLGAKKTNTVNFNKDAVLLNAQEGTLVHIKYSEQFLQRQKDAILAGKLSAIQRMGLVRNMKSLAENGSVTAIEVLEYLALFKKEANHLVLAEIWGTMLRIMHIFGKDESIHKMLENYCGEIFANMWQYMSYDTNKRAEKLRSAVLISVGYRINHAPIIQEALEKFRTIGGNIPPHLRATVYRTVVRYGSEKDKTKLWQMLAKEQMHEEKFRIMASFSAVVKARDLIDVLGYYNSSDVKNQDAPILIARLLNETNNPEIVWNYIEHNWTKIVENYGKSGHLLSYIISGLASVRDEGTLKHMKAFFKKNPAPSIKMSLSQMYEKVEGNILYYKSDARELDNYLRNLNKE